MYVIIAGAGELGYYLTKILLDEEHDVVVIDKSNDACTEIASKTGVLAIRGDATDPNTLEKAGVHNADALIALTGTDETNIIICLVAKSLGMKKVVARLERTQYDEMVLKHLGIDLVVHPEADAAKYIEELITKPEVADLAFLSKGAAEILEVRISEDSPLVGKKIKNLGLPSGTSVIAMYVGNDFVIPSPEDELQPGDKVLLLTKKEVAERIHEILGA